MAKESLSLSKVLLNKKLMGLLLKSRTRKIILGLKNDNIFLSEIDKNPDKDVFVCSDKKVTYSDFKERINRLNNGLLSLGLEKGDHISILSGNSNLILELILGPSRSGIIATPINWHLNKDEIEYVVSNSKSKVLIVEEEFLNNIIPIKSKLKEVKKIIVIGDKVPEKMISYEKFLSESSAKINKTIPGQGFMLYTSGTTGRPKGAHSLAFDDPAIIGATDIADFVLMMNNIVNGCDYRQTTNRHLVVSPLYHGGPLAFASASLYHGGTIFIMRKFDPEKTLQIIEKEKISTTFMPPIILKRLMDFPDKNKYDVSSLKVVTCAAAPCPAALKKRVIDYFGPVFYELYGSTEAGYNFVLRPEHYIKDSDKIASVGKIVPANYAKIVDENDNESPCGTRGDLYLSNAMVKYLEYYRDPDKTKGSFVDFSGKRYFREGEVAYVDDDGFYYVVDRKKDMIISGGANIYPAEIEEAIYSHPSVSDVAVIGVPDEEWGESVKAVIVLRKNETATSEEIIKYCSKHLARYKRPKSVDFVNELPRRPDGKLVKRLLRDKYHSADAFN